MTPQHYLSSYIPYEDSNATLLDYEDGAILLELNQLGTIKPILKVKDMMRDIHYKVFGARRVNTKYGSRVVLQLEKNQLFLPARYEKLSEGAILDLNQNKYNIVNKGQVLSTFNLEFVNVN